MFTLRCTTLFLLLACACAPLSTATRSDRSSSCNALCLKDRLVLITNSTSGIGRQAALELGRMGAHVIVHGRDPEEAQRVATELKTDWLAADPSSMEAVRGLAAEVKRRWGKLDVLINHGLPPNPTRELTADGYERTLATNHLAHFLLTNLLLPWLIKGTKPRVVQVATAAYTASPLDFDDLMSERGYDKAFPRAKAANILFMRELAKRTAGTGLTVNALHAGFGNILHPGLVEPDFFYRGEWSFAKSIAYLFAKDEVAGARCAVYLASSDEVAGVTGTYFVEGRVHEPKPFAKDEQLQQRLWEVSEQLTRLKGAAGLSN